MFWFSLSKTFMVSIYLLPKISAQKPVIQVDSNKTKAGMTFKST